MTNEEIQDIIEDLLEDYNLTFEDISFENENISVDALIDDTEEININMPMPDPQLKKEDVRIIGLKALKSSLYDYDYVDSLEQQGISQDTIDRVNELSDISDTVERTYYQVNQELDHKPDYNDFEIAQMEKLAALSNTMVRDGYQANSLELMQDYAKDINAIAQCEPLYRKLEQDLFNAHIDGGVFMCSVNFFNYITTLQGSKALKLFEQDPNKAIQQVIKDNNLK